MKSRLSGKTALVTGASRGIGRAIATRLTAQDVTVIGTARASSELKTLDLELTFSPTPGFAIAADLTQEKEVKRLFEEIDGRLGRPVDILINNAGIAEETPFAEQSFDSWRSLFAINVDAVFLATREMLIRRPLNRTGHIVFVASDASFKGIGKMGPYCATKHAVHGLAKSLAEEYRGSGVRFTTLFTGSVNTTILRETADRHDITQPEDIADSLLHALSMPERCEMRELYITPADSS
ncbi:SDR family oxidoreductase [Cohnella hongkongensis]|uniref:SDR family oxidoreductase n=1 Tax=Cohnella hongkongensis TaxID=178337 RepID=A0ABV9F8Y2_9BACL